MLNGHEYTLCQYTKIVINNDCQCQDFHNFMPFMTKWDYKIPVKYGAAQSVVQEIKQQSVIKKYNVNKI